MAHPTRLTAFCSLPPVLFVVLLSVGCEARQSDVVTPTAVAVDPTPPAVAEVPLVAPDDPALQPQVELMSGDVRGQLRAKYAKHTTLDYRKAREHIFSTIDNRDGWVEGVYTGARVQTSRIPDPNVMNCEHSWPRSRLSGAATSDLHHLFPADAFANKTRSNIYFGDVVKTVWEKGGSKLGDNIRKKRAFEVRPEQRGNTARAMFYVATIYDYEIPFWEEEPLRQWHIQDPVDDLERKRNDAIEKIQGNRNPFVDHPEYVERIKDF